jgi:hypothetical protein
MKRWLTGWNKRYASAKTAIDRRYSILAQLEILSDFATALCPGDQLKPVRQLILALIGLDRGIQTDLLRPPHGAKPRPISELRFRARMAAATQMYHEDGTRIRKAASDVIRVAGTPDVEVDQIEDWRQACLKGDPETDICAFYYHRWTNPKSGIVVGPSESASGTDNPQADIDAANYDSFHPDERVGWSGGALRTKTQYAEWLARTASRIRSMS